MPHTPLATPITVNGPYGPVTCTHEDVGVTWQGWNDTAIAYRVIGVEVDGVFKAVPAGKEHEKQKPLDDLAETTIRAELVRVLG